MIVRIALPDEMARRLREMASAERRTPRAQAAYIVEQAIRAAERKAETRPPEERPK